MKWLFRKKESPQQERLGGWQLHQWKLACTLGFYKDVDGRYYRELRLREPSTVDNPMPRGGMAYYMIEHNVRSILEYTSEFVELRDRADKMKQWAEENEAKMKQLEEAAIRMYQIAKGIVGDHPSKDQAFELLEAIMAALPKEKV